MFVKDQQTYNADFWGKNLIFTKCITCLLVPIKDQELYVEGDTKDQFIQAINIRK